MKSNSLVILLLSLGLFHEISTICFQKECTEFSQTKYIDQIKRFLEKLGKHKDKSNTLQQLHVLFRHGDRTPDYFYPNDPHINETFYPYGLKELTNAGKVREYNVGKELRKRYNAFLGDTYLPYEIEARSSNYNRTKISLQLVLAGMYPPVGDQVWLEGFNWQPISTYYLEGNKDFVFLSIFCPNFSAELGKVLALPELQEPLEIFTEIYPYLTEHTGMPINNPFTLFELYWILKTEDDFNLELPKWTKPIYPELITHLVEQTYVILTYNKELKKLVAGGMLTLILERIQSKINNIDDYKVQLYSGHEINIASVLRALNVFDPHVPEFGSHIIIEVHLIKKVHHIKIIYQDNRSGKPIDLKLPNCDMMCPLNDYIEIIKDFMIDWNSPCSV